MSVEQPAANPETRMEGDHSQLPQVESSPSKKTKDWSEIWDSLLRLGLGEAALRVGTGLASIVMVLLVVWIMSNFYLKRSVSTLKEAAIAASLPTDAPLVPLPYFDVPSLEIYPQGITRLAVLHTDLPAKPRLEVIQYAVQKGDTIFGIAQKFNLRPETILWGNYYILADDPHALSPGQLLNILPVNGVYYEWHAGDGLNGVAEFYKTTVEEIVNFPANHLSLDTVGDLSNPNIPPGTWLVVPGGRREFVTWSAPRITRDNPAVAKIFGPGACGTVMDGPVGNGSFLWPSIERWLSGYDYSPETNHYGIDVAGSEGNGVFAVDNGVVVYAGWNDWGYGNVVVIDHGNGWQTLYAHLSAYNVECGSYVYQGDAIGAIGNTGRSSGPHLHFEMRSDSYGKVNPHNFLQ
ncbi:MAG: M23 family metallopeptidase [Anaerolineaceae bacterium]|nr:M23 family metallopeptidase [Anaerolineaceae bacterium]